MKKGEGMMKKRLRELGVFTCVLCLAFVFATGCAKKQVLQGESDAVSGQAAVEKQAGAEVKATTGKSGLTAEELAAREKALKEQAEKELLAREQAAAAAEKASRESVAVAKEGEVLVDIHFDFDSFSLTPESREILQKHVEWLSAHPGYSLIIEGHCDDRGTTEYNLALGERRAVETQKFLVELGINKSRIKTISYGEEMPLDPAENEEAWTKNRRVHFVVNPEK